ncbi:small ribosomal subunit protein uS11m-like [Entelurus aequoreus]|uniref:small ribosomal subunit protein uS11m-like n=1 Tax=Entelurus aequoreus TaxID=161455 RepID=UPI002B1CEB2B|nr:small ribosomal subunit protein uS11m-like [Entelurus aequoreus]XP_061876874.1 small ribosomal subunit protein uS11m-like [Entelurus aequoreus]
MFKLTCVFVNSLGSVCRHVAAPLAANRAALRTLCSSAVRLQETARSSKYSTEDSKEFSHVPPLPGQDSPLRWAGKKFEELPIVHIKATYNNVQIQLTDCDGQYMVRTSCGMEGFKNRKKATPVAAQTTGMSAASKANAKGVTFVRVVVKGLGPGRLSAIQGLTMGGLEVVSITDDTPVPHNGCRPRKARRV